MQAFQIIDHFGLDQLKKTDLPDPKLERETDVILEVDAVSLNFRDLMTVEGHYNPDQPLPLIPCSDASARVIETGPRVSRVSIGDRVSPIFNQRWIAGQPDRVQLRSTLGGPLPGTLARRMRLSEEGVVLLPDYLEPQEGATLGCAAVTAWNALTSWGGIEAGQRVLVQGSGGVATFAVRLASAMGAEVYVTSSSDNRLERLHELGAHYLLKRDESWSRNLLELTGGQGVDRIVELGGAESLPKSVEAVRPNGTIVLIGVLSGIQSDLNIVPLLMKQVRIQGILVGSRQDFERMNAALEVSGIRPVIDRVYPFEEAPKAFTRMREGKHFGKIVIDLEAL